MGREELSNALAVQDGDVDATVAMLLFDDDEDDQGGPEAGKEVRTRDRARKETHGTNRLLAPYDCLFFRLVLPHTQMPANYTGICVYTHLPHTQMLIVANL